MLIYHDKENRIEATTGGYLRQGYPIRDTYVQLGEGFGCTRGILYEPVVPVKKSSIAVIIMHSDVDFSTRTIGGELAKRGYRTFAGAVGNTNVPLDVKLMDVKRAVDFFKAYPGVERIILMGHSGGATLMTAYQRAAENGAASMQGDHMLYKLRCDCELTPADGFLALDPNLGNGAMTLLSIDPAVIDDQNGVRLNPKYNPFAPENGFDPAGANYTEEFLDAFYQAQAERNNRLIDKALSMLDDLEHGRGRYTDDDIFAFAGTSQLGMCNKLIMQDTHLFHHTRQAYPLIHADGSITEEIIQTVRKPRFSRTFTPEFKFGTMMCSLRAFLSEHAVRANENYRVREDRVEGVDWDHTYNCPPGNIKHIHVPLLSMGMTASYEFVTAEEVYQNSPAKDKQIAFVEGASHSFNTEKNCEAYPGQYGDTEKLLFDYCDQWLSAEGRFL